MHEFKFVVGILVVAGFIIWTAYTVIRLFVDILTVDDKRINDNNRGLRSLWAAFSVTATMTLLLFATDTIKLPEKEDDPDPTLHKVVFEAHGNTIDGIPVDGKFHAWIHVDAGMSEDDRRNHEAVIGAAMTAYFERYFASHTFAKFKEGYNGESDWWLNVHMLMSLEANQEARGATIKEHGDKATTQDMLGYFQQHHTSYFPDDLRQALKNAGATWDGKVWTIKLNGDFTR